MPEWIDHLMNYGTKLTSRIAEAEGMLIHTPGKFKINLWEEDGYQKKRETGNRERVAGLIEALRAQAASLVIFDPLRHFHSLNELNVDHVAHLFEVFRAIGRAVPCGAMIVHHHRKTARSQVEYEGAEDMSGSWIIIEKKEMAMVRNKMRPIHPGEILREEYLEPMGMSANSLAKALNVTPARINDIVRERRGMTADTALRLARYFGTDARSWMNLQAAYDLRVAELAQAKRIVSTIRPRAA
jgi:antitoxin HigA-1